MNLPKIICTSVVRSSYLGEAHGGCYIVDLKTGEVTQVVNWKDKTINWEGRGGDRGLRGIAFFCDMIYIAASNEIFVFDKKFNICKSYTNKYLKHCHEIYIKDSTLFLTSTAYNSILEFDLIQERFTRGYHITFGKYRYVLNNVLGDKFHLFKVYPSLQTFDPNDNNGPKLQDILHINNVFIDDGKIFFSGTGIDRLYYIKGGKVKSFGKVPYNTHNTRPYYDKILFNDTSRNRVVVSTKQGKHVEDFTAISYDEKKVINNSISRDFARQGFCRGLAVTEDGLIIGGSSPSTISVYEPGNTKPINLINLTMDMRNCIHGLEVYHY